MPQVWKPAEKRPVMCQRVRIKTKAVRRTVYAAALPPEKADLFAVQSYSSNESQRWRVWNRKALSAPIEGWYIGCRKLQDGVTWWEGDDVGMVFSRERDFEAWLIVTSEHQNPVLVFPEDVEVLDIDAEKTASVTREGRT